MYISANFMYTIYVRNMYTGRMALYRSLGHLKCTYKEGHNYDPMLTVIRVTCM